MYWLFVAAVFVVYGVDGRIGVGFYRVEVGWDKGEPVELTS